MNHVLNKIFAYHSKMDPEKIHFRHCILYEFYLGKNAIKRLLKFILFMASRFLTLVYAKDGSLDLEQEISADKIKDDLEGHKYLKLMI